MKKGKKYLLGFMMLLTMALFLAACNSEEDSSTTDSNTDSSETTTEDTTKEDTSSSTPQVLVFGRGGDSVSLDPAIVTDGESFKVTQNLFETLLNFGEQDTTINPGLAKEWTVSDDGLTYTFQLKDGVLHY